MRYSKWQEEQEQEGKQTDCTNGLEGLLESLLSLIVIMLFRLRMPIDAAIRAYVQIGKRVFSKKDRSPELESAVVRTLSLEKKTLMWEPEFSRLTNSKAYVPLIFLIHSRNVYSLSNCSFVCAGRKSNVANPIHFPTWESKDQKFKRVNCTIVEAICATCATPNIFQDTSITEEPQADTRPIQYTGADLRWNNPVLDVWEEAKAAFTSSNISHIVSIGTGATEIVERHSDLSKTLMDIAKDCEKEYEEAARLLLEEVPRIKFIRLNVQQGLQTMEWETQEYGDIKVHTEAYLQEKEVDKKLDDIVTAHLEAAK